MQEIVEASKEIAAWTAGGWATKKLLGPTFDYLGGQIQLWTQKQTQNVNRIFEIAVRKLGSKIEQPGTVPPRVLKGILMEGAFCNDRIAAEYFGGVLAASRTESGEDDRAVSVIQLLSGLSSYQIRSHYIFYTLFRKLFEGKNLNPALKNDRSKLKIFFSINNYAVSMGIDNKQALGSILSHITIGLNSVDLISDWVYGSNEHIKKSELSPYLIPK